ncbi:hypothetical protein BCV69DRAFT_296963 [Microstroma glucosiphilum]|uniref:SWR1-complex protein 5 n=1 Tax=Pseudomicrostroma glucosiphilum TaxID=1684307 RepID=A0A316UCS8_9BASI|nr:hypothetical protein BCV69DRAFT_296963 [Pseudomicrostroma glucosiphilum]PWN22999.1 hypothetical protein BCV69DRAFT_296963 [Pseudomicrostroma glucosiphilum]
MTTTGSAHTPLPAGKGAPHQHVDEDEEEEDQDFNEVPRASGPALDTDDAKRGPPSDSASDSEDDEADAVLVKESEPVDEEELAALKRDAEEQQSGLGGQELGRGKRRRKEGPDDDTNEGSRTVPDNEEAKAAWAAFQDKADSSTASGSKEMVKIIERYKFAGDEVIKERLLPADHPDAIAYLKWAGSTTHHDKTQQDVAADTSSRETAPVDQTSSVSSSASRVTSSAPAPAPASASASAPRPPPPGPRRKKQSKLASLAASSDAPKKMNTLEKSKMDWEGWKKGGSSATTSSSAGASGGGSGGDAKGLDGLTDREREEMEQQTKTGSGSGSMAGYLGRSDFLERVKERTEGQ